MNEDEHKLTHAEIVGLLPAAYRIKGDKADYAKRYDDILKIIRSYLEAHRNEELRDGETGIKAFLQPRQGSPALDWRTVAHDRPDLAVWALEMGLATLNNRAFEALEKSGQFAEVLDLKRYLMPGLGSEVLQIVKEQDRE